MNIAAQLPGPGNHGDLFAMAHPSHTRTAEQGPDPDLTLIVLAFAAIYLVWGSTYLAIRWAIETMPPLTMAAARFFVAGAVLFVWARARGGRRPTPRDWRIAGASGLLMLAGGNGAVVVSEQWVPSGLVALLVASVPLWLVVLDALFGSKSRPDTRTALGLLGGFGGVALLIGSPGVGGGGGRELLGVGLVMAGSFSWAAGSLISRYGRPTTGSSTVVAMQMLCASLALAVMAGIAGELGDLSLGGVSAKSWFAFGYLVIAGALIGYVAYIWLLGVVSPARVGTYAYVNPVVALFLGWSLGGEPLGGRVLVAAAVIIGSVTLITLGPVRRRGPGVREARPDPGESLA